MFAEELVCRSRVCVGPTGAEATWPTRTTRSVLGLLVTADSRACRTPCAGDSLACLSATQGPAGGTRINHFYWSVFWWGRECLTRMALT